MLKPYEDYDVLSHVVLVRRVIRMGSIQVDVLAGRCARPGKDQYNRLCFTGGKVESGDPSVWLAATRETAEELEMAEHALDIKLLCAEPLVDPTWGRNRRPRVAVRWLGMLSSSVELPTHTAEFDGIGYYALNELITRRVRHPRCRYLATYGPLQSTLVRLVEQGAFMPIIMGDDLEAVMPQSDDTLAQRMAQAAAAAMQGPPPGWTNN